jgi:hypothetical protein
MPMLVNDKQVVLPVVHCRGALKRDDDAVDVEMTVLNDPENPMDLAKRVDDTKSTAVRGARRNGEDGAGPALSRRGGATRDQRVRDAITDREKQHARASRPQSSRGAEAAMTSSALRSIPAFILASVYALATLHTVHAANADASSAPTANPKPAADSDPFPITLTVAPAIVLVPAAGGTATGKAADALTVSGITMPAGQNSVVVEIKSEDGATVSSTKAQPDDKGRYSATPPPPTTAGRYKVSVTAPDGRGKANGVLTAIDAGGIGATADTVMAEAVTAAIDAIGAVEAQIDAQIESPPKANAKMKLTDARQLLDQLRTTEPSALKGTIGAISANVGIVFNDPGRDAVYQPRLNQITSQINQVANETASLKTVTTKASSADVGCHQLAFATEVLKTISALLNLKSSTLNTILGFAKDINADIASNVTKNATGSSPLAFLSRQLTKNAPELGTASKLAGNAYTIMADLGAYITGELFDKYCEQISGSIEGIMNARFYWLRAGQEPKEWWTYNYKISGRIILYFPKSAKGNSAIHLNGRIEGYAHGFETQEDALPIMSPRLMAGAQQYKRSFPPIELGGGAQLAAQGSQSISAYLEGSGSGIALPNSFLINVTGTMDNNSITVKLGNALTDISAAHHVTVVIMSPLMAGLGPTITWYRLKFQKVRDFIVNAIDGETFTLPLKTSGNTLSAKQAFTGKAGKEKAKAEYTLTVSACDPGC